MKKLCATGILTFLVSPQGFAAGPTTTPDFINAVGGNTITIQPLLNDNGNTITLREPNRWSLKGGTVSRSNQNITLRYTPKPGFNGEDKIWYVVSDFQGLTNSGVITITVSGNNSDSNSNVYPTSQPDSITTGSSATIDVLANDTGNGLVLDAPNPWSQKGGRVSLINNKLNYRVPNNYSGIDKVWYTFKDSQGRSNSGVLTITVLRSVDDFIEYVYPSARLDEVNAIAGQRQTIDVLANDDGVGLELDTPNPWSFKGGNVLLRNNKILYTSKPGFNGEDKIWYTFKDVRGRSNTGEVIIDVTGGDNVVVGPSPVAKPDFGEATNPRIASLFKVLENDIGNGLKITYANPSSLKGGQVSIVNNQSEIVYFPPIVTEPTTDKIWYTIEDNQGRTNFGVVTISVR